MVHSREYIIVRDLQHPRVVNAGATCQKVKPAHSIGMGAVLTDILFLVNVTVTVTMEPAVMLLLSSSSRTVATRGRGVAGGGQ